MPSEGFLCRGCLLERFYNPVSETIVDKLLLLRRKLVYNKKQFVLILAKLYVQVIQFIEIYLFLAFILNKNKL
ncbi:unnamed protein product [Rhizophagus irregularis]|nr:unnamed protein product [Rhizophagus irregularis]